MLMLDEVKNYIRATDEDNELVLSLMEAANSYMSGAIDDFNTVYPTSGRAWQAKANLAMKMLIADWYENRTPVGRPVGSAVTLLITQLQNGVDSQ